MARPRCACAARSLARYAYNLVLHHHGDMLYDGVQEEVRQHLLGVAQVVASNPDETLLQALGHKWRLHKVTMVMIRDILMYMVRHTCRWWCSCCWLCW